MPAGHELADNIVVPKAGLPEGARAPRPLDSPIPHEIHFDSTPRMATVAPEPEELEFLFRNSMDLICVASTSGFFLKINPAFRKILGWSNSEIKAKPFLDFVHPEDREYTESVLTLLSHGQPIDRFENRYLCKKGKYKLISWNAYPRDHTTLYAVGRDVTNERKSASSEIHSTINTTINAAMQSYFASKGKGGGAGGGGDEEFKPLSTGKKVWNVLKWLGGIAASIFFLGVGYQQFISSNATKTDIDAHIKEEYKPAAERIKAVEAAVGEVKAGVDTLVVAQKDQKEIEKRLRRLDAYRAEYQEAMSDYAASKAAGRRVSRPRKTQAHLDLEAELKGI